MEMTVKDERKLVEIWLTNAEKSDPVLRAGLQSVYDTYKKKKYLPDTVRVDAADRDRLLNAVRDAERIFLAAVGSQQGFHHSCNPSKSENSSSWRLTESNRRGPAYRISDLMNAQRNCSKLMPL